VLARLSSVDLIGGTPRGLDALDGKSGAGDDLARGWRALCSLRVLGVKQGRSRITHASRPRGA